MTNEGRACGDGCPPPACHGASGQVAQPCACEPKAQQSPSHHAHQPVAFPCATVKDKTDGGQPGAGKKSSPSNSKLFIPSYLHEKEIMARMVAHDYGRQWLAERDAWHQLHATSDDHLRERMLERCRDTEARYVDSQKCYRNLKEEIARGRLAGSKNKYRHIQGALNTHWNPYPPTKGWRC
ncbi:uncharacterized protein LOC119110547 isoform X1 [Pollicipes pollicipes]|uniref:uncharacterized protein LOC119110547 isoform X1 n=1 Tax=Pollicipes pollicipes TaxID=41117 RepID=UPI00188543F5|nr:uncharacterized protein LOC119110547 isoform X1 [Pollicipes pollicipes]